MKTLLLILITMIAYVSTCQDTTFYDMSWNKLANNANASFYMLHVQNLTDTNKVTEHYYFISGQKKIERTYSDYSKKILDGTYKQWYENGQLKKELNYSNGTLHGKLVTFWKDGSVKRVDSYDHDTLRSSKCFNADGVEISYFPYEKNPVFPGGDEALMHFLVSELKYPKKSRRKGIEGNVMVRFVVNTDGSISHVEIIKHANQAMDAESMRVVRKMPRWEPGMIDGEPVQCIFQLPVRFKLE